LSSELSVALQRCLLGGKSGAGDIQLFFSQFPLCLISRFDQASHILFCYLLELMLLLKVVGLWLEEHRPLFCLHP
jgi:hypothetical protein